MYSLGVTLYELLTGAVPFNDQAGASAILRILEEDPDSPRMKDKSIPRDLEAVVLKCLEKEPGRRYDSAKALAEDLGR